MASEIRVNTFKNRSGLGTVSINDSGASFSGVVTATSFSGDLTGNVTSSSTSTFSNGLNVTGGNVGIGTDNPQAVLHAYHPTSNTIINVESGDAGAVLNLIDPSQRSSIEQNGTTLKISSDTGAEFASSDIRLQVDGGTIIRAESTGNVKIDNGNLVFSTSGTGIDFSATSNSSGTMSSELLDDYEEGTWSPTYTFGTTNHTSMVSGGTYVKVGKMVFVTGYLYTNNSSTYSGTATITGLPFAIPSGLDNRGAFAIGQIRRFNEDMPNIKLYPGDNGSSISMFRQSTNSNGVTELTNAQFNFQSEFNILSFSGSYPTS